MIQLAVMKPHVLACTINCRHYHTSPSIRILRNIAASLGLRATIEEFGLNEPTWKMAASILRHAPKVLALSIYIWNRRATGILIRQLKLLKPDMIIVVGGPEVEFEVESVESESVESDDALIPGADKVLTGDIKTAWPALLSEVLPQEVKKERTTPDDAFLWAYQPEDRSSLADRIVYLETASGCPFRCSFCMGWREGAPRSVLEPTHETITRIQELLDANVKCIKFLDRTFNYNPARALYWFKTLSGLCGSFHFEIRAELIDDETFDFLKTVRPGVFQFEIGVQSLNPLTLMKIGRPQETSSLEMKIRRLIELRTVRVHVDLIFGLPEETIETVLSGFDRLYAMCPDEIQLGFLKSLPGSAIRRDSATLGLIFENEPPYEIMSTETLSASDLQKLRELEFIFNLYSNSGRFKHTLAYIFREIPLRPYEVFAMIARHFNERGLYRSQSGLDDQYRHFYDVFMNSANSLPLLADYMRLDYVTAQTVSRLPDFLQVPGRKAKRTHDSMLVPFEHSFDCSLLRFDTALGSEYYRVTRFQEHGYFNNRVQLALADSDS